MKGESVDSENRPHSVNDLSAEKYYDENYVWYNHGDVHRDGDKPAIIGKKDKRYQVWAKNNLEHRLGDLPAETTSTSWKWYQEGLKHRLVGPAEIAWIYGGSPAFRNPETRVINPSVGHSRWSLYGASIPKDTFYNVMTYIEEQGCPPWVAWFYFCEIFEDEDIASLKDASSGWTVSLPTTWIFNIYGLTEQKIKDAYDACRFYVRVSKFKNSYNNEPSLDKLLIEIIKYENEQITNNSAMAKDILANLNSSNETLVS